MNSRYKWVMIIIIIVILTMFSSHIRYFISRGNDIIIAAPDTFYFYLATSNDKGLLYSLYNAEYDEGLDEDGYDSNTKTYHIFVDSKYLDNNDVDVYISGNYWNYLFKPIVKVNGTTVDEISSTNTGYTDGPFSSRYFSKLYHFDYRDKILSDHIYEFYARCEQYSDTIMVVFHGKSSWTPGD